MASFKIEWKRSTKKDLRKIVATADALKDDPFPEGSLKLRGSEHTYRARVGNCRIIYEVFTDRKVIEIQKVRDRKDVYRE